MALRRILLFGLSADPPTGEGGHLGVVRWAAQRGNHPELGGPIEALWVVPVDRHAYTQKAGLSEFKHRFEMCRRCFEGHSFAVPVLVSDVERHLSAARPGDRLGTIDLIEYLEPLNPGVRFALLLGEDTAQDLFQGRWKRAEELRRRVDLVVVPRLGANRETASLEVQQAVAKDAPPLEAVSSTQARQAAQAGAGGRLRTLVTTQVAEYIETFGLYGPFEG